MERTEQRFTLDVQKTVSNHSLAMKRGETAHRLLISLTEGGKPYSIGEDCRAVFSAAKPDGTSLFNECAIEDGVVIYDISEETTAVTGVIGCEIMIYGGEGELLTSATFLIIVWERAGNPGVVVSSNEFTALSQMIYAASIATNAAEEAAEQAREAAEQVPGGGVDEEQLTEAVTAAL